MRTDDHDRSRIQRSKKHLMFHVSYVWYCSGIPGMPGIPVIRKNMSCRQRLSKIYSVLYIGKRFSFISSLCSSGQTTDLQENTQSISCASELSSACTKQSCNQSNASSLVVLPYLGIILLLPSVFSSRCTYLYQLNVGMNQPPRHELLVS